MAQVEGVLFACTRCYARHPFEKLSPGRHLCKGCQDIYEPPECSQIAKCAYCRSEFQQTRKDCHICSKCEHNLTKYGQPNECECCSLLAAFIGKKCQRCHNSEKKYGPPVYCQQCRLKCAFERDDDKKIEGMQLCWLCTLAYKRALAKTKPSEQKYYVKHKPERIDVTQQYHVSPPPPPQKQIKLSNGHESAPTFSMEAACTSCSKYLVSLTQLQGEIANLRHQLTLKNKELMLKDMQVSQSRAEYLKTENDLRFRMKQNEQGYESQLDAMRTKMKQMQKDLAVMSRLKNKNPVSSTQKKISSENAQTDSPH